MLNDVMCLTIRSSLLHMIERFRYSHHIKVCGDRYSEKRQGNGKKSLLSDK